MDLHGLLATIVYTFVSPLQAWNNKALLNTNSCDSPSHISTFFVVLTQQIATFLTLLPLVLYRLGRQHHDKHDDAHSRYADDDAAQSHGDHDHKSSSSESCQPSNRIINILSSYRNSLSSWWHVVIHALISICFVVQLALCNVALRAVPLSSYQATRSSSLLFSVLLAVTLGTPDGTLTWRTCLSCLLVGCGFFISVFDSSQRFCPTSIGLGLIASFFGVLYMFLFRYLHKARRDAAAAASAAAVHHHHSGNNHGHPHHHRTPPPRHHADAAAIVGSDDHGDIEVLRRQSLPIGHKKESSSSSASTGETALCSGEGHPQQKQQNPSSSKSQKRWRGSRRHDDGTDELTSSITVAGMSILILLPIVILESRATTTILSRISSSSPPSRESFYSYDIMTIHFMISFVLSPLLSTSVVFSLGRLSPLSCSILGFAKSSLQTIIGNVLFGDPLTTQTVAGVFLCLVGCFMYSLGTASAPLRQKQKEA